MPASRGSFAAVSVRHRRAKASTKERASSAVANWASKSSTTMPASRVSCQPTGLAPTNGSVSTVLWMSKSGIWRKTRFRFRE